MLRVVIADDERPARSFLAAALRAFEEVEIIGEAEDGAAAVELIERTRPDLALLDLQMPEVDGLGVVRLLRKEALPLVAFVTAYDEYAVRAFELNAVDYLLKPVAKARLAETIARAQERLERADLAEREASNLRAAADEYEASSSSARQTFLERVPVRLRDEIVILPVREIASVTADGELLRLTTARGEKYTINYRLRDLENRLDPALFIRLARGTLANVEMINRVSQMPGGTYVVTLSNKQQLPVSRLQSRVLRDQLLRI